MQPECEEEIPDYVAAMPCEIPPLLEQLDLQVKNKRILEYPPEAEMGCEG